MHEACEGVDYILHHGARLSSALAGGTGTQSPLQLEGTFNVLEAARAAHVKRFIYAASSSAYGDQPILPCKETMRPMPISPYAVQKLTGEYYASSYWQVYGFETVSMRYFNVFGPRLVSRFPLHGVVTRFIHHLLTGARPTIFGTGDQARDLTYVDNVVAANLRPAKRPQRRWLERFSTSPAAFSTS